MRLLVGVDVGGTFTDAVAFEPSSGRTYTAKVRSTPEDQSIGFAAALEDLFRQAGATGTDVERVVHGTTVGTNAILERRGARIGVIATEGFRDTLYLGRQKRTRMYDLFMEAETPGFLAPRHRVQEVAERVAPDGSIVRPLDEAGVERAVRALMGLNVEAIAICFLFAYANGVHEERAAAIARRLGPDLPLSLSHRIDPRFREYERLTVTGFDAYVRPVMERYVGRLRERLRETGVRPPLQIIHSRGGITSAEAMLERPVATVLSGLAAGVLGGQAAARRAGIGSALTIDIGGTSADVALVRDGAPLVASEGRVGGYPLRLPMIDVETVGAGGGSIASVDDGGGFSVGPRSAGADPGPACYGRGGAEPTVTDASLVLGYLNPAGLAGGLIPLDRERAERAIHDRVAVRLGLATIAAARGMHRVINGVLANALSLVSIKRGEDPREYALVTLGGAGPVHGGRLAAELGVPRVIVPLAPGVLSAQGLLVAKIEHQRWSTVRRALDQIDGDALETLLGALDGECALAMARDDVGDAVLHRARSAEIRYVGQSHELTVPLPEGSVDSAWLVELARRFHATHRTAYGQSDPGGAVEIVAVHVQRSAPLPALAEGEFTPEAPRPPAERSVWFDEYGDAVPTPVWRRATLQIDQTVVGPAIVEQVDTTTVIYPGQSARVLPDGSLLLSTSLP